MVLIITLLQTRPFPYDHIYVVPDVQYSLIVQTRINYVGKLGYDEKPMVLIPIYILISIRLLILCNHGVNSVYIMAWYNACVTVSSDYLKQGY